MKIRICTQGKSCNEQKFPAEFEAQKKDPKKGGWGAAGSVKNERTRKGSFTPLPSRPQLLSN